MRAMRVLSFFRRTKSRYADDKTVDDFARVAEQAGILSADQRTDQIADLMAKDNPTPTDVQQIAKLLGGQ